MKHQIIALVDCDSFFVSCEQSLDKTLQGTPVCVLSNNDACVVARSREAKQVGVRMGMPYFMAKKEYPNVKYVSGDIAVYRLFSKRVMEILRDFTPDVQVYSIDEAFIELSGVRKTHGLNYYKLAKKIRETIKKELDINVSIGISSTKVLAKLACETSKHAGGGIFLIGKSKIPRMLKNTKIEEIWGIGRNITALLHRWGILTCEELVSQSDEWLQAKIGIRGRELKQELLGVSVDAVKLDKKIAKSIQNTRSFPKFSTDKAYIKNWLNKHIHTSCVNLRKKGGKCRTVGMMLKTKDFITFYEKTNLDKETDFEIEISKKVMELFEKNFVPNTIYRSCGVVLENLNFEPEIQLNMFSKQNAKDYSKLGSAIDRLENKFGKNIVRTGFVDK